jgi:hypothetical protein
MSPLRNARSPRAVAAVDGAEIRDQQQYPIRIPVHEPRYGAVAVLAERVFLFAGAALELGQARDGGSPQRLLRILRIDQAHVVGSDADRQGSLVTVDRAALLVRHMDHALEVSEASNPVAVLPAPVVPFGRLHARKMALAKLIGRGADDKARFYPGQLDWRGEAVTVELSKMQRRF